MRWLFDKLRWVWKGEHRRAAKIGFFEDSLAADFPVAWQFRPEVTSLDQWMELSA
jgi:hypothetical protein